MKLTKTRHNDIAIIKLDGDVMGGPEAVKLNEEINHMLDEGTLKVVIDLEKVKRMNSSGLGILINALTTYKQNGGELKLANPAPVVKNLLDITKLKDIFEVYDETASAINSF
jgi:anti-sigma B factor antagonist